MAQFHKQSFTKRFATMGDPAEAVFDLVHPRHHKLGLNRPNFNMLNMPVTMRQMPDRMLRDRIVECMGVGRDRLLKLKVDKEQALVVWEIIGPVWLFVYDSHKGVYYEAPLADWVRQFNAYGSDDMFENDGKRYTALHVKHFPTDPKPVPTDDEALEAA